MATAVLKTPTRLIANMGEIVVLAGDQTGHAILGSCLGVVLYDSQHKLGALAHIVLPQSDGGQGTAGKYVDTAIPWMINALRAYGANTKRLVCKLAGGANMFANDGPLQIGRQNIAAARRQLAIARIHIVAEHVEGTSGRRVTLENQTGEVLVEVAGELTATL